MKDSYINKHISIRMNEMGLDAYKVEYKTISLPPETEFSYSSYNRWMYFTNEFNPNCSIKSGYGRLDLSAPLQQQIYEHTGKVLLRNNHKTDPQSISFYIVTPF